MKLLIRKYYDLLLGLLAVLILGLLIIYLVLAMMSVTSGVSQTVSPGSGGNKTATFNLGDAAALGLN